MLGKTQGDVIMPDTGMQKTASPEGLPGKGRNLSWALKWIADFKCLERVQGVFQYLEQRCDGGKKKKKKQVSDGKPQKKMYYNYLQLFGYIVTLALFKFWIYKSPGIFLLDPDLWF